MRSPRLTVSARYIFPVEGPPIPNGFLTIDQGRIGAVGASFDGTVDIELGNVAITPGFVNAHTHLELAPIAAGKQPQDEISWLRRVIEQRRSHSPGDQDDTIRRNLAESIAAGTTFLADTTTAGSSWNRIAAAPIRAVVFAEILGLKRERGLQTSEAAWDWISSVDQAAARARPGLSPHAPYSTAGWLYHRAATSGMPLSTHLAEMPEELELLATREGPLRQFLEDLGAWDDDWEPIGARPADYVRKGELREADWLIAHGTYLDPSEFWRFGPEAGPNGHRVAIAYCPRTHARFGHAPHPYRAMLERGVIVCLGTDSLASADTLGILDEARFLHRRDPSPNGPLLLTMATLFGAWALRAETTTGSLKVGKSADLAIVALPDAEEDDPHDLLFKSDLGVIASMFEGEFTSGPWMGR